MLFVLFLRMSFRKSPKQNYVNRSDRFHKKLTSGNVERGWLPRALPCKIIKYRLRGTSSTENLVLCELGNAQEVKKPFGANSLEDCDFRQKNGTLFLLPLKTLLGNRGNEDEITSNESENKYDIPEVTMDKSDFATNLDEYLAMLKTTDWDLSSNFYVPSLRAVK